MISCDGAQQDMHWTGCCQYLREQYLSASVRIFTGVEMCTHTHSHTLGHTWAHMHTYMHTHTHSNEHDWISAFDVNRHPLEILTIYPDSVDSFQALGGTPEILKHLSLFTSFRSFFLSNSAVSLNPLSFIQLSILILVIYSTILYSHITQHHPVLPPKSFLYVFKSLFKTQ